MKIGIITQPLQNNYGGLLQNYALQQILKRMGHEVITIDQYGPWDRMPFWVIIGFYIKTFILRLVGKGRERVYPHVLRRMEKQKNRSTISFIEKYINRTAKVGNYKSIKRVAERLCLDGYVVGSDQVWRPCYTFRLYNSFLDFTQTWDVKRIAYAASFGVDDWEFSRRQTRICKAYIKMFDAVSVRELSGIRLCRDYLNHNVIRTLDPTMLLNPKDYEEMVKCAGEKCNTGTLLVYILDDSLFKEYVVTQIACRLKQKPFSIMPAKGKEEPYKSVTEWLRGFMDAKFVICDSFHGAVFSIIFNKPFVILANRERGMARFDSLLEMFGLEERLIFTIDDLSVIDKSIDWERINRKRNDLKESSIDFLMRSFM